MKTVKIVIACESSFFCEGMATLLQREKDIEIVGKINHASRIMKSLDRNPDVIILDPLLFEPEKLTGVIDELKLKAPRTRIILVFSEQEMSDTSLMRYMMRGVDGYIKRAEKLKHVIEAIRTVHAGSIWAERKLLHKFVRDSPLLTLDLDSRLSKMENPLTKREKDIVTLLVHGLSNKRISSRLHISEKTVKTHLNNVFKKMNVTSRTQVISSLVYGQ
ncbi:MAG TPA: response regulator transcription factor [Nitrospirota bacterium]